MISLFISLGTHFTENIYLIMQFKPEEKSGCHLIFSLSLSKHYSLPGQLLLSNSANSTRNQSSQYFSFQKRLLLPPDFGSQQQVQDQHSTYCHASLQVAQFITEGFSVPFIKITECKIQRAENNVILDTFLKRFKLVPVLLQILENTH